MNDDLSLEQRLARLEESVAANNGDIRRELSELRALVEAQLGATPPLPEARQAEQAHRQTAPVAQPEPFAGEPARRCQACSALVPPGARFCVTCGVEVRAPLAAPPVQEPAAPAAAEPVQVPSVARPPAPPPRAPRRPLREMLPPISTTMVLAWMGGVIAVLGLTFLFVLAASRGWLVPPLRLAIGVLVSSGLLGFAVWFHHRREGRYEAVLAAAGTGIAGLYTTLFAAGQMYHYLNRPAALAAAGAIALLATAVALDVDAEPLAIFGVCAAILAPLLVAHDVTPLGLAFGALIGAVGLVCMVRYRWLSLTVGILLVGLPQVVWMVSTTEPGFGLWVLGPLLFSALWAATMYVYALRPAPPRSLDQLSITLASVVSSVLAATAFQAGRGDEVLSRATNGWLLAIVALVLMAGAFLPWALDRSHPDLADLMGAYALTALAISIGLLLHGSALVCGWAVEAGGLAVVAARMRGRGEAGGVDEGRIRRAARMYAGATVYLAPAIVALGFAAPPREFATIADWGSHHGLIGLIGLTTGAAVWSAVAVMTEDWPEQRRWTALLPLGALAYAVPFFVDGQWVVVAWAALATALSAVLAVPRARRVLGEWPALVSTAAVLALGVAPTMHQFAWLGDTLAVSRWGSHDGLTALASLVVAATALAAGCLRLSATWRRWTVAAPLAAVAYAIPFVLGGQWVIVAWSAMAAALASVLLEPRARRLLGQTETLTHAGALLALAVAVTVHHFATLSDSLSISNWGSHHGLVPLASVLMAAAALGAGALRTTFGWRQWVTAVPVALLTYAAVFVLTGNAALVTWTAIVAVVALALHDPRTRRLFGEIQLFAEASALLVLTTGVATAYDRLAWQLAHHGRRHGIVVSLCLTAAATVIVFGVRDLRRRGVAFRVSIALTCVALATFVPGAWAVAAWAAVAAALAVAVHMVLPRVARLFDVRVTLETAGWLAAIVAAVSVVFYETPSRLFQVNPSPAIGIAGLAAAAAAAWLVALASRTAGQNLWPFDLPPARVAIGAAALTLWTVTAALLGAAELQSRGAGDSQVERHFQQGQVAVSVTWGLTGLLLLYLGFRSSSRALRTAGIVLLFVTPVKLVLYDLAFLPATARAASFIVTGVALIGAAFLMQRLGGQEPPDRGGPTPPGSPAGIRAPSRGAA
jgi:uncharacterized membrane protein